MPTPSDAPLADRLAARAPALAESIMQRHYELHPGLARRYSETMKRKSLEDAEYNVRVLSDALDASMPEIFGHHVAWLLSVLRAVNVPDRDFVQHLEIMEEVLVDQVSGEQDAEAIREYMALGRERVKLAEMRGESFLRDDNPLADLARTYMRTLLDARGDEARRTILDAVDEGAEVRDVYLHVFQPVQHEVGRLWQLNEIGVAHEHYVTAMTQFIMSQLYSFIFSAKKIGRRLVAVSMGGELHELGIRMVADFFEMEGWDTLYLGANTPRQAILSGIEEWQPEVLALSATLPGRIREIRELIETLRASTAHRDLVILVGGNAFNRTPELWERVGADGTAQDARSAVQKADDLLKTKE